ncbi:hypothetical protein BLOT_014838 [Blomia tropicalis]|nr:hypothetical protein BLOT_014838 [Blomia tropicalis]
MVKQCRTWKNLYRAGRGSSKEQMVVDGKQSERLFDTGAEQSVLPQEYFGEPGHRNTKKFGTTSKLTEIEAYGLITKLMKTTDGTFLPFTTYIADIRMSIFAIIFIKQEKEDSGKTEEDELESEDGMFLITAEGLNEDDESETNNRAVDQQLKQIGDKWTSQAHELGWTDQVN